MISHCTPQQLIDLYSLLPAEDQAEFLKLLGRRSIAEVPFVILSEMPIPERGRYSDITFKHFLSGMVVWIVDKACQLVQTTPGLLGPIRRDELRAKVSEEMGKYDAELSGRAKAEFEDAMPKNRADEDNIMKYLRWAAENRNGRSVGSIAQREGVDRKFVRRMIGQENHWHSELARINANRGGD